jgi:hypothetical protein
VKFKILTEEWLIGLEINNMAFANSETEYHEILINPSQSEAQLNSKAIIDAEGNVYVDKPFLDQYITHSHAIHCDILKAIKRKNVFKAEPKLMVYKWRENNWQIADDDNNDIKDYKEFEEIKTKFKKKTGGNLKPDMFKPWMCKG